MRASRTGQAMGRHFWAAAALLALLAGAARGGDLNPPAAPTAPGSAMYTLSDLYNLINNGTTVTQRATFAEPAAGPGATGRTLTELYNLALSRSCPARTGQTSCFDADGNPISCSGTGQDGDKRKGVAWPNPRFIDNGNGTVTDNLTGLIWLKAANYNSTSGTTGTATWTDALAFCNVLQSGQCGLTDGSTAGQWRLPNLFELESLRDMSQNFPALPTGHPFSGVQSYYYWSSTTWAGSSHSQAWYVYLNDGSVSTGEKTDAWNVWPVRGGQ